MPYEDDYKMWLEKALIRMNPDWVCDEMSNNEFTHNWCHQYCGEDDAYITPKCLHMYYHHIVRADRKTENNSEKPNNCDTCKHNKLEWYSEVCDGCSKAHSNYEPKDEPKTQTKTQNSNLTFEKVMEEIQTQVIEFPDTHQKFTFARKIEMDSDSIKIGGWEYKGVKDGEREGE